MTRRLEDLFDLPQDDDSEEKPVVEVQDEETSGEDKKEIVTMEAMSNLEKIDSALPAIKGLESSDEEMDEIAEMAISSYRDLFDLGMNVEARVANEILNSSSQFLGHAITAKNAKINKKLRMIELQLRKAKLDQEDKKIALRQGGGEEEESEGQMLDRNELLAEILAQSKNEDEDKKD